MKDPFLWLEIYFKWEAPFFSWGTKNVFFKTFLDPVNMHTKFRSTLNHLKVFRGQTSKLFSIIDIDS